MKKIKKLKHKRKWWKTGYAVAIEELTRKAKNTIESLKLKNGTYEVENFEGFYIGVWNGIIDKSLWVEEFAIAYFLGKKFNQEALWDWKNRQEIYLVEQKNRKISEHIKTEKFEYWIYED